jgi:hypothetical protein
MGHAGLRIVTISHPLGGIPAEEALEKAGGAAAAVTELVLGGGESGG